MWDRRYLELLYFDLLGIKCLDMQRMFMLLFSVLLKTCTHIIFTNIFPRSINVLSSNNNRFMALENVYNKSTTKAECVIHYFCNLRRIIELSSVPVLTSFLHPNLMDLFNTLLFPGIILLQYLFLTFVLWFSMYYNLP